MTLLRASLRRLARAPVFTATTLVTLGLGLGAAAAVLELADTLHFRRLPFGEPDRRVLGLDPLTALRTE